MTDSSLARSPFQLFDALPSHIEDALRASIERFGVLVPIAKDQHGNILDGHHRERIAKQLGVQPRYDRIVVEDEAQAQEIARTLNSDRRQLTEDQRREVVRALREQGHSVRAIAGALGVGKSTVDRDVDELSQAGQLDQPDRVRSLDGKSRPATRPAIIAAKNEKEDERAQQALTIASPAPGRALDVKRIERIARETAAELRRAEPIEPATLVGSMDIRHGDFREVLEDIEPGSVDAIITDPPYPRQFWDPYEGESVYEGLARLAARVLRPNGVMAVMTGTRLEMLDNVDLQMGRHMRRRHRAVYLTPGQRWRDQNERVATGYKPILIFSHPDADDVRWINDDVFTSSGTNEQDTRFHHWGQSESGFASLVERLTEPGQLVLDPFLGGGTTAVVCRDLGRRFVGCDIDAAHVTTSRERVG